MNEVAILQQSQAVLDEWLLGLTDGLVAGPSLLPGWTVGHVLAHIALNAEAFVNVAAGVLRGAVGVMYPGGDAQRDGDIESMSNSTAELLRTRITGSSESFLAAWSQLSEEQLQQGLFSRTAGAAQLPVSAIVMRRVREVEVHHHDAGLPWFSFKDWSDAYVEWDLAEQLPRVQSRLGHAVSVDSMDPRMRPTFLAWMLNRTEIPGLGDPGSWMSSPIQPSR